MADQRVLDRNHVPIRTILDLRTAILEVLMVTAQSHDGWAVSWTTEIVRSADGQVSLGECRELADFRGRFGKLFG